MDISYTPGWIKTIVCQVCLYKVHKCSMKHEAIWFKLQLYMHDDTAFPAAEAAVINDVDNYINLIPVCFYLLY